MGKYKPYTALVPSSNDTIIRSHKGQYALTYSRRDECITIYIYRCKHTSVYSLIQTYTIVRANILAYTVIEANGHIQSYTAMGPNVLHAFI